MQSNTNNHWLTLLFFSALLFIFSPIISILFLYITSTRTRTRTKNAKNHLSILVFFLSFYLGLLNSTKEPISDLKNYISIFILHKDLSFLDIFSNNLFNFEPLFLIFTYVLSQISLSHESVFIFTTTFVGYYFIGISIIIICEKENLKPKDASILIIIFFLLPPLFNISAHLIRQFIASSIILLFIALFLKTKKRNWSIFIAALTTHSSTLIFSLLFLPKNKRYNSILSALLYSSIVLLSFLILISLSNHLTNFPVIGRLVNILNRHQSEIYEAGINFNTLPLFLSISLIAVLIYILTTKRLDKSRETITLSILVISLIFITFTSIETTKDIAGRIFFFTYFTMIPAIIFLIKRKPFLKSFNPAVAIIMLIYFFYNLHNGPWTFNNLENTILSPLLMFF